MRTIAFESRAYVLSANQCVKRKHLPDWLVGKHPATTTPESLENKSTMENKSTKSASLTKVPTNDEVDTVPQHSTSIQAPESHELALPASQHPSSSPAQSTNEASDPSEEEFVCRGGSCIIGPDGTVLAGPLWEVEEGGLLSVEVDFENCERGRLDLDVAGSYGRGDAFHLKVDGLDISPPP